MAASSKPRMARAGTAKRQPQILQKAAQLFQGKGYHATSMDELANALKLNKATIYHHFPGGKSDLLYGIAISAVRDLLQRAGEAEITNDSELRLRQLIRTMIDVQLERPDATIVYHEEVRRMKALLPAPQYRELRSVETEFRSQVSATLQHGVSAGVFRECDPGLTAVLLINLASSAYRTFRPGGAPDAETLTERYAVLVLDGLRRH
jgi:AcrR family transcriptional regulator